MRQTGIISIRFSASVMPAGIVASDIRVSKTPKGMEIFLKRTKISLMVRLPDISIAARFIKQRIIKVGRSANCISKSIKLYLERTAIIIRVNVNKLRVASNLAKTFFLEILFSRIISTKLVSAFSKYTSSFRCSPDSNSLTLMLSALQSVS